MGVSKNGWFINGKSHQNGWFGGTPIWGNHQMKVSKSWMTMTTRIPMVTCWGSPMTWQNPQSWKINWLVLYLPLWKIWKLVGMMTFPTEWKNKTCSKPPTSKRSVLVLGWHGSKSHVHWTDFFMPSSSLQQWGMSHFMGTKNHFPNYANQLLG